MSGTRMGRAMVSGFLLSWGMAIGADAANREWKGADYNDDIYNLGNPLYWDGGVPDNTDVAIFTGTGTNAIPGGSVFSVQLPGNATVSTFHARDGQFELTFDLAGYTFTTQDTANTAAPFIEGSGTGVVVNLVGGGTANWTNFRLGGTAGTTGTLNLTGSGTKLTIAGLSTSNIGSSGTGTFNMSGGAQYTTPRNTIVGSSTGSSGTWTLTGPNTSASSTNHIWIGGAGSGSLTIQNGASVTNGGGSSYMVFGQQGNASQQVSVLVTGANSLLRNTAAREARGIYLGGNAAALRSAGTVHVTVADQGRMEATRQLVIFGHRLTVDNGTVQLGSNLVVHDGSRLDMVVYGAARDALIQADNDFFLGQNVMLNVTLGTGNSFAPSEFIELIRFGNERAEGYWTEVGGSDTAPVWTTVSGAASHLFVDGLGDPLPEGAILDLGHGGGLTFQLTYAAMDGGDTMIGLTVIPEPSSVALLVACGGLLLAARWRRRLPMINRE